MSPPSRTAPARTAHASTITYSTALTVPPPELLIQRQLPEIAPYQTDIFTTPPGPSVTPLHLPSLDEVFFTLTRTRSRDNDEKALV